MAYRQLITGRDRCVNYDLGRVTLMNPSRRLVKLPQLFREWNSSACL